MSGRRRSPPPAARRSDRDGPAFEPRRDDYRSTSRYELAPSKQRSPSPQTRLNGSDRYREERDHYNPYERPDKRRDDRASRDFRHSRPQPRPYDDDASVRHHRKNASDNNSRLPISVSSRHPRRSVSPCMASPPSRVQGETQLHLSDRGASKPIEETVIESTEGSHEPGEVEQPPEPLAGPCEESEAADEDAMAAMMGFGGFATTKGRKVSGNEAGAAEIKKERTWRQYMNRKGGFNRPLDKIK